MTREQYNAKIVELLEDANKDILRRTGKLARSGAISWDAYEDNYELPKLALAAILRSSADDIGPLEPTRKQRSEMHNFEQMC